MNSNNSSNEIVYGQTFSAYSDNEFESFSKFFERRLINNGISPQELFEGKNCLDAGCGGGRGSWLMLKYGAKQVTAVDQLPSNTSSLKKRLKDNYNPSHVRTINSNLEELRIEDEFDFVWFSGVIQHTITPSLALRKVYKHLSIGGWTFFYAYGKDGIYWQLVDIARKIFNDTSGEEMLEALRELSLENRYISEYMDDWKVPFLRAYTNKEMRYSLGQCGITPLIRLYWGETYDTCLRPKIFQDEESLWGEGDLRYLGFKSNNGEGLLSKELDKKESTLSADTEFYHPIIKLCESILTSKTDLIDQVAFMAKAQRALRDAMNKNSPLNLNALSDKIKAFS